MTCPVTVTVSELVFKERLYLCFDRVVDCLFGRIAVVRAPGGTRLVTGLLGFPGRVV